MKYLYTLFFLITIFTNGLCQEYDTLSHWKGIEITPKYETLRLEKLLEAGGGLFRSNYIIVDTTTGKIVEESFYKDLEENGLIHLKKQNGNKLMEDYMIPNAIFSKSYFDSGNLEIEVNGYEDEDFGFKIVRKYYDNEWNTIEAIVNEKVMIPEVFDALIIENFVDEYWKEDDVLIVEQKIEKKIYLPVYGMQFYPNGVLKERGSYAKKRFWKFRSKEYYEAWKSGNSPTDVNKNYYKNQLYRVKHGEWEIYSDDGNMDRIEVYEYGILKETKQKK